MTALVTLNNLMFGHDAPLLPSKPLNASFQAGEITALIGPSGVGKSTLLSSIFLPQFRHSGAVEFLNQASGVGYMPQSTAHESMLMSALDIVAFGSNALGPVPSRSDQLEAMNLLMAFDIAHLAHRRLGQLSGGQQQRVLLARAVLSARRSKVLLLDEPTANVDSKTQKLIHAQLAELASQGYAILLSTHDLDFALQHAHVVVALNATRVDVIRHEELESSGFLDSMFSEGL